MERGQVHPKILEKINSFGIDKEDPEKKKTKKEIFQDVIRKSKHEKMLRQKGQAEQKEKIKLLDDMFTSLFPALTISDDRYKPKNEETRQYDTLRNELIFEPTMPPEHLKKEGKEATSSKRKKIDLPENDENGEGEDEEGEEDGGEEGEEEEEYEDYEDKGDDQEQLQEREIDTRKFKERIGGKKEKLEENCGRTVRNLKMLGELEDQLLEEFVRGMNDQDLDGEEEEDLGEEEQFIGGEGEEEFEGDDEMGDEELEGGEEGEEEDEQDED